MAVEVQAAFAKKCHDLPSGAAPVARHLVANLADATRAYSWRRATTDMANGVSAHA
jgi:hypothetical protein